MASSAVKRGWKAEEHSGSPPPYTDAKRKPEALSSLGGANPDEKRVRRSNSDLNAELAKGLGPEYVSTRKGPGNLSLSYLSTSDCIDLMNEIFGSDGWSSSIVSHDTEVREESNKWIADSTCVVRITVRWPNQSTSFHEGHGYGGNKSLKGRGEALEGAIKEAESDALKRAARLLGRATGNCVYDKDYLKHLNGVRYAEKNAPTPMRWTAEDMLRKPSRDGGAKKQQKLSFHSPANGVRNGNGGPVRPVKTTSTGEEDYFKSEDEYEGGLFVEDDQVGEF